MLRLNILLTAVFVLIFCPFLFFACKEKKGPRLIEMKRADNFPSGSGLTVFGKNIYIAGDDASWLLKTDSVLRMRDSIPLFHSAEKRIPKELKADLESITVALSNNKPVLLLLGSGSSDQRNRMLLVDPETGSKKEFSIDTFYRRLKSEGLNDLNIEGSCAVPGYIILACRGNKGFPRNYLIFTSNRFWEKQDIVPVRLIKTGIQTDTSSFAGISGLDYSGATDQLLLTVSTENTSNSYDDGSIGKSYLWIINDISSKRRLDAINPDRVIDLEEVDSRFRGHKIESVCILSESKSHRELLLVSDNDKGETMLFRLIL